ncbi:HAD-IB family hydrolase [Kribbella italica]|uniref:Phosphoserine phosphatase n=1 Tax=Kribbella italica TaxID=1540520 RepID=A0A7W9JA78_9ACTN|nr:phosphoserine phosphatase [Kribbella italica]
MTRDLRARSVLAGEASAAAAELEAALATPSVSHAAAFFDVDNTLLQGASVIFDELMADRIWPGTKALAQQHLDAGERVWLVTAAPVEVARVLARRLGLTGALGTVAAHRDGVYTGVLVGDILHGPAKAEAVRALARHEELDLTACSAYSDSVNDLPMLEMVGNPWAINPDSRLLRHARTAGWPVRDYRTGRRATRLLLLTAGASGVTLGAVSAAVAIQRCLSRGCGSRRRVS